MIPPVAQSPAQTQVAMPHGSQCSTRIEAQSNTMAVRDILDRALACLSDWDVAADRIGPVHIVLAEVMNNVVEHAYSYAEGLPIALEMQLQGGQLSCTVIDSGKAFPDGEPPVGAKVCLDCDMADMPEGGFGWFMIREQSDSLSYERRDGRNHLTVNFSV